MFRPYWRWSAIVIVIAAAMASFGVGYISGVRTGRAESGVPITDIVAARVVHRDAAPPSSASEFDFRLFWEVWSLVQREHLRQPVSDAALYYGALSGLVAGVGDPYSTFFDPDRARRFRQDLAGQLEGIGAEIGIKQRQLTVIAPLPDSPAARAGIASGDIILAIDDRPTANMTLEEAISRIRGPEGSAVRLLVLARGQRASRELAIVRAVIHVTSVRSEPARTPRGTPVAVLTIAHFNGDTAAGFDTVVRDIIAGKYRGIVLDLRNNPGGFLETAIDVAGAWVDHRVVVRERKRDGSVSEHQTNGIARLASMPTVVLVNAGTASAAEIVSGALQDYHLATIIGESTFGKGTVQNLTALRDGSAIKLTIAEWLTPAGRSIEGDGIRPDIVVTDERADSDADPDPQMARALAELDTRITRTSNQ
jgi:carboxyl-terminal processing protease